jgi:uncharacterized membrane protein
MSVSTITPSDLNRLTIRIFLIIAIPVLLIFTFLTGPFQVSDEPAHFLRAIAISHGQITPVISTSRDSAGGLVESSAANLAVKYGDPFKVGFNEHYRFFSRDLIKSYKIYNSHDLVYAPFSNTAIYFPAAHAPQAAAIFIARLFGINTLGWLYAGRLINVALFILISCYAISILRGFEVFVVTFLFLPMGLFEAASISADPAIITLSLILCGLIKFILEKKKLRPLDYILFGICFVYVGLSKFAYIPICLLPLILILLNDKIGRHFYIIFVMTILLVLSWVIWVLFVHNDVFNMRLDGSYVNVNAQVHLMISRPRDFLVTLVTSIRKDGKMELEMMVGSRLGWLTAYNPRWAFKLSWALLILAAFVRTESFVGSVKTSFIIVFCVLSSFLMMYMLLYLQFTPVGGKHIDGMQGRYFLPLAALAPIVFGGIVVKPKIAAAMIYGLSALSILPLGATMWTLLHRYWQL